MLEQTLATGPLAAFAAYRQFICFRVVANASRPGKFDKLPCTLDGTVADAHDPNTWASALDACQAAHRLGAGYGVGFVFTDRDPFWFLDIDGCLQADNTWSPLALSLLGMLPGAAVEVSLSGRGLHVFGTGAAPVHGCKNTALGLEFYHTGRFVALTGTNAVGDARTDLTPALPTLVTTYFTPVPGEAAGAPGWTEGPAEGWNGPVDDVQLIERAMRSHSSRSAFGGGVSFADLWQGAVEPLARAYPDASGARAYDASSADMALAMHLAFWTGRDCERVLRLMRQSGLVRAKWDREDYLRMTILNACGKQDDYLTDRQPQAREAAVAPAQAAPVATPVTGSTFLTPAQQIDFFAGCTYVCDVHRVLVPGGFMLKPDQFKVMFGGYSFNMDAANERISRDAWEAFLQNQAYRAPRADTSCFRPDCAPGAVIESDGQTEVNTYWPIETPRMVGDATPFLKHLEKVLPDERDRTILLSYMAACVQHKGIKFQWAPLLQGVEGNGKTMFTRCVAFAIGDRYVHFPKAEQIAKQFNAWMHGTIFIGVEDIYVPESQREVLEALKPMITSDRQEVEYKGVDKQTRRVCCNFILNSNHKDGIRKTRTDRRFAPFYTAQQRAGDLARDGMGGNYFPRLYNWLRHENGYAIVSELLHTYPIPPEFNPAHSCQYAPLTTSTDEAIGAGMGALEQEVIEAIEQGTPGFCGGWVSSMALDRLFERLGERARRLPPNKRRELLQGLGYDWHPGLPNSGRVNSIVAPDAGKPRLFVKNGHDTLALTDALKIARAYAAAQAVGTTTGITS